jgi:hypothetical protein
LTGLRSGPPNRENPANKDEANANKEDDQAAQVHGLCSVSVEWFQTGSNLRLIAVHSIAEQRGVSSHRADIGQSLGGFHKAPPDMPGRIPPSF